MLETKGREPGLVASGYQDNRETVKEDQMSGLIKVDELGLCKSFNLKTRTTNGSIRQSIERMPDRGVEKSA